MVFGSSCGESKSTNFDLIITVYNRINSRGSAENFIEIDNLMNY